MKLVWAEGAPPRVGEYLELCSRAGLTGRRPAAAAAGLDGGLHTVTVRAGGRLVGMGRVIGDGGLAAQIVDVAVDPKWQRQGIGAGIMARLTEWGAKNLPKGCYLSLIADPGSYGLYRKFGFEMRTGMARRLP